MGREIELKIPLSAAQYDFIYDVILGRRTAAGVEISGTCEHILKSDEYYSRYNSREESRAAGEPQVIRIRGEEKVADFLSGSKTSKGSGASGTFFFCIKRKSLENGIELNREDETFVENPDVIRDILTLSGYHKFFEKKKDALSVYCKAKNLLDAEFHLELELVNELKYLEVEVTEEGLSADKVRAALEEFVAIFGLDANNRDSRSWMAILSQA
ncbi:MAG: hypothetical protein K5829_09715 [Treponema sp.]|nr:hypothetical protein [Treponema sp.]